MLIEFLREALFGEQLPNKISINGNQLQSIDSKAEFVAAIIVPDTFKSDIENLKAYVGEDRWQRGLQISLSLQELLSICPRERKRSDAYGKLIQYLVDEWNINLIILKSKNYEKK